MALTIPHSFTNVGLPIIEASEVNANNTAIKSFVDALQAGTNITALAITTGSIAANAITAAKLDSAVTSAYAADGDQIILGGQVFG